VALPCSIGVYILGMSAGFSYCGSPSLSISTYPPSTCQRNGSPSTFGILSSQPPTLRTTPRIYNRKRTTYPRTIFIHPNSHRWRSTPPPLQILPHSWTRLLNSGLPCRPSACGSIRKTSKSSERFPSMLEVSPTSGLARWAIKRSRSSLTGATRLQTTPGSVG
jgi:hypothetical protein